MKKQKLRSSEPVIPYKEYHGKATEEMPRLIADGRIPISVAGVMLRRLEVLADHFSEEVRRNWLGNIFDTGDGVAYHVDGRVKIVPNAPPLRNIDPFNCKLVGGVLVLEDGVYEQLEGLELSREEAEKYYTGRFVTTTKEEVKSDRVWRFLARGDDTLLNEYADLVFAKIFARIKIGNIKDAMRIYITANPEYVPTMRRIAIGDVNEGSRAYGTIADPFAHFVGVAPGVSCKIPRTLEERVRKA